MTLSRLQQTLSLALLASLAPAVKAQVFFATGFENNKYATGQSIDGVDGWTATSSPAPGAIVSGRPTASRGRRALRCSGDDPNLASIEIAPGVFLLDGAWFRDAYDAPFPHRGLARVQCDMRLDGPVTQYDMLSANLIARNGSWNSAQLWLSSDGNVYCNAWGTDPVTLQPFEITYQYPTPVPHGQYVTMAITYDYSTHLAAFEVAGVVVGVLPFGGPGEGGFNGVFLEFAAYDDPAVFDPTLYTGYWDNVGFFVMPQRR